MKYEQNVRVVNMDEEIQPKVLSDLTVKPISNGNLDSVDEKPGSYMLSTVVDIANQVSVEIRQNHPLCFSQLPIVVIQRYEPDEHTSVKVTDSTLSNIFPNISSEIMNMEDSQKNLKQNKTIDHDESSTVSNGPSVILPNNHSTNCLKRSSSNESLNNEKPTKFRLAENLIEEQCDTYELSNVSNEPSSNYILPNNDSTNYTEETQQNGLSDSDKIQKTMDNNTSTSSKTVVFEGVNVDMDANNIKIKEEIPDFIDDCKKDFKKVPKDILALKKSVQYLYSKSIKKMIKNEVNEEVEMNNGFVSHKIVELDHHYYKSLSPENSQEKKINEVTQPTGKISPIQTDNMNEITSIESELINIEDNDDNNLQGSVINGSNYNSQSLIENDLIDQVVECNSVDATNDIPAPVAGEFLQNTVCDNEGVEKMSGIFQFYDDERWEEFSNDVDKAQDYILPKLFDIFERSDLTFTAMERMASKKIDEIMRSKFDKYFQRKNEICIKKNEQIWREKYTKLVHYLREIKALLRKHDQELEVDKNAVPRKLRRHIKTQTKRPKNMGIVPQQQKPVVAMHFTDNTNGIACDSSNPEKKASKSTKKSTQNTTLATSTPTSSNNTLNLISVPQKSSSSSSSFIVQSTLNTGLPQTIIDSRSHNFPTNFVNPHCKPVYVVPTGNYFPIKLAPVITPIAVPKGNAGSGPRIKNYFSLQPVHLATDLKFLRPVPPAIPIDDNLPTSYRVQNQQIISPLQQLLQAPTKKSLVKKTPKVNKPRKKNAASLNSSIVTIDLVSPEPPEEPEINETAPSFRIGNQKSLLPKRQLLPALTPTISGVRILKDAHELCDKSKKRPIEIFNLVSPEPPEELDINVPSATSEITNQKHPRASTQTPSVPGKQLKKASKAHKKEDTNLNSNYEVVSLLSPECPEESDINDSVISNEITNQKDLCASTQQSSVPAHESLKVTDVTIHENYEETLDEFPFETIDLSSPEISEEPEINDLDMTSGITSQKPNSAENPEISEEPEINDLGMSSEITSQKPETIQTLVPTQLIETSNVAEETAHGNCVITPEMKPNEIINLSSPESSSNTDMNEPSPSNEITNQSYVLAKIEPSEPTQQKETSKVAEETAHGYCVITSDMKPNEIINLSSPESSNNTDMNEPSPSNEITNQSYVLVKIEPSEPTQQKETSKVAEETAHGNCVITSDMKPNEIINLSFPESSSNTEMNEPSLSNEITNQSYVLAKIEPSEPTQQKETSKVDAVVTHDNDENILNILPTESLNLPAEEECQKLKGPDPATQKQISLPSWKPIPTLILKNIREKQTPEVVILEWHMDITSDSAEVKKFEVFCRRVISEIPTNDDNWVKLGEGDFKPLPIACVFKKQSRNGKCQFSVRLVDVYNRVSPFCSSGAIFLD